MPVNGNRSGFDDDPAFLSDDSDYGAVSNRSLASTAHNFRYENGRRYHAYKDGSHIFPNDDLNAEHEIILHHIFILLFRDQIYLAPIKSPKHVIDLGTGTGLWATDFAYSHEEAQVVGVDLNPHPMPRCANLEFLVDDITQEWTYGSNFDFVHIRSLFASLVNWPIFYRQCFDNMAPGGYIQQAEIEIQPRSDKPLPQDSVFRRWRVMAEMLHNKTGRSFFVSGEMKAHMAAAGFVEIVEKRYSLPLGAWSSDPRARDLGKFYELFWRTGMHGWIIRPATQALGWTEEMVNEMCRETSRALDGGKQHLYYHAVVIYARKP